MSEVNIGTLKAHLSRYLRKVRRGEEVVVLDRRHPIARIVPYAAEGEAALEVRRAAEPFPTVLGTLDAIHLSTALLWRDHEAIDLTIVTHDVQLARAARALGFPIEGCPP